LLPEKIVPMEPVLEARPPEKDNYLHSVKWDGVRQLVYVTRQGIRVHNRKLRDRTYVYPELHLLKKLTRVNDVVLDGEVVALNEEGRPDFSLVMRRDNCGSPGAVEKGMERVPVFYMVFDLLYHKGENIMQLPLTSRLELLGKVLPEQTSGIQLVPHQEDGQILFQVTGELGMEGVVSKDKDSRYLPGAKSRLWIKAKHFKEMVVTVGGFTTKRGILNSLSVGAFGEDDQVFYYLGNVSSGLSEADISLLDRELRKSIQSDSPFGNYGKKKANQFWVIPRLNLKVRYLELTGDLRLRHPVIVGFI